FGLFMGLFGFGFSVGTGRQLPDGLAETHSSGTGGFRLEGSEAAQNVQVLGNVGSRDALAQVLESVASRGSVLSGESVNLPGDDGVMAEDLARRGMHHVRVARCGVSVGRHRRTVRSAGPSIAGWATRRRTSCRMAALCECGRGSCK